MVCVLSIIRCVVIVIIDNIYEKIINFIFRFFLIIDIGSFYNCFFSFVYLGILFVSWV